MAHVADTGMLLSRSVVQIGWCEWCVSLLASLKFMPKPPKHGQSAENDP
jgi:hypothetical protein